MYGRRKARHLIFPLTSPTQYIGANLSSALSPHLWARSPQPSSISPQPSPSALSPPNGARFPFSLPCHASLPCPLAAHMVHSVSIMEHVCMTSHSAALAALQELPGCASSGNGCNGFWLHSTFFLSVYWFQKALT